MLKHRVCNFRGQYQTMKSAKLDEQETNMTCETFKRIILPKEVTYSRTPLNDHLNEVTKCNITAMFVFSSPLMQSVCT